jgi:hypothetical protein
MPLESPSFPAVFLKKKIGDSSLVKVIAIALEEA